jgi:hypothetical protein
MKIVGKIIACSPSYRAALIELITVLIRRTLSFTQVNNSLYRISLTFLQVYCFRRPVIYVNINTNNFTRKLIMTQCLIQWKRVFRRAIQKFY